MYTLYCCFFFLFIYYLIKKIKAIINRMINSYEKTDIYMPNKLIKLYRHIKCNIHHRDMEKVFTRKYQQNKWGKDISNKYKGNSGPGSTILFNIEYIEFLKNFIINNNIKNIVDLGCGDFRIGEKIYNDINVNYTGYDIYKDLINSHMEQYSNNNKYNFIYLDFYNNPDKIINSDLIIIKEVLQHWPNYKINQFLDYIKKNKKFKYLLLVNCKSNTESIDIGTGGCRGLSYKHIPLLKYNGKNIFNYNSQEVVLIK